jgi:hypothetical protein
VRPAILVIAAGSLGCNALFGVDDLEPRAEQASSQASGGAAAGGASGAAGSGGAGGCGGSFAGFSDAFEDGVLDLGWEPIVSEGSSVVEARGRLRLVAEVGPGWAEAAVWTRCAYDLRGSSVSVEIVKPPPPAPVGPGAAGVRMHVASRGDAARELVITLQAGLLSFFGLGKPGLTIAFDLAEHRGWRISERGGRVFWDTWDGVDWLPQYDLSAPPELGPMELYLGIAGTLSVQAQLEIDNVNVELE